MKSKLITLAVALVPAAVYAGVVPLPNSPTAYAPWRNKTSASDSAEVKGCLHAFGRGTEKGLATTEHAAKDAGKGVLVAAKEVDHVITKTGRRLVGR